MHILDHMKRHSQLPHLHFVPKKSMAEKRSRLETPDAPIASEMARSYPRDMLGYGRQPPAAQWPDDAAVCVQFVLNYEEGGENNILHGDAGSEAFLSEIVGAASWPGQRHWNMESIYEYGAKAGFWRLWRMFTSRNMPVTVYGVTTALARSPEQVAAMKEASRSTLCSV
jgi:peptidoglycan/xylan/chitin deacetylase (PgdA/CDA1 family)